MTGSGHPSDFGNIAKRFDTVEFVCHLRNRRFSLRTDCRFDDVPFYAIILPVAILASNRQARFPMLPPSPLSQVSLAGTSLCVRIGLFPHSQRRCRLGVQTQRRTRYVNKNRRSLSQPIRTRRSCQRYRASERRDVRCA